MTDKLVIALAQLNPTVGKIGANLEKPDEEKAAEEGTDLLTSNFTLADTRPRTSFESRNLFHRYGAPLRHLLPKQVMMVQRCF